MPADLEKIKSFVERRMKNLPPSHDFDHVLRVYKMCKALADEETDINVLLTAALLHDVGRPEEDADPTGKTDHAVVSAQIAEDFLKKEGYPEEFIEKVKHCILAHRFRSGVPPESKEAKILFDADKLDSLGAVGIARLFSWIGENKARLYSNEDISEYAKRNLLDGKRNGRIINKSEHAANIEFELRKDIAGKLYTEKARKIAEKRLKFMEEFFKEFLKEVEPP